MQLTGLARYPVKSLRGETLTGAVVEPWGLAGDRRWMVVDPEGMVVTAREVHPMLLVTPAITADGLTLTAPDRPTLGVPTPTGSSGPLLPVRVGRSEVLAATAGDAADAWVSETLGRPLRLVHLADPTQRATNPSYTNAGDRVSLADGYPLLLTGTESLTALNDAVIERSGGDAEPLPMTRFRPNLVVSGAAAYAEDDWRRIRIGEVGFRVVKGCDRCVMTTLDPDTAAGGHEPIATLAATRRFDGLTWFGVQLVPDLGPDQRPVLSVGDPVEVLDAVEPGDGPPR